MQAGDESPSSSLQKKLLFPNMEDLVIPILNSGLPEDVQKELAAPSTPQ